MVDFLALACAACRMFQVQQEKKSKKWTCVVCGAKQTLMKVHARGTSREMRPVVQGLNMKRGQLEAEQPPCPPAAQECADVHGLDLEAADPGWNSYLDDERESEEDADVVAAMEHTAEFSAAFGAGAPAGGSSRKRSFAALESEVASAAARSCDAATAWKRQRVAACTPHHNSPCGTPNRGAAASVDAVPHAAEETMAALPRWHIGLRAGPNPTPIDPFDAFADLSLSPPEAEQPSAAGSNMWAEFL
eukprot:TRINITY_DN19551_c0_g1_i1.p2 TRINITY_DN19551_c0_g1~~TRINITY_DN19551_c0_g1_i1.p2  ORF type:complete len:247 (+),score=63.96 TRINITY_DN19551_c0_g1_i1:86-826(+)